MRLDVGDLSAEGQTRLERDFQTVERRDGGKTSRADFALGWMALAVRFGHWNLFTNEATERLRGPR